MKSEKAEHAESSRVKIAGSGRISGGTYQSVKVAGSGKVDGDLTAETVNVSGSCNVEGHVKAEEISSSGSLNVNGDVEADEFRSKGSSKVHGNVTADVFKCSGSQEIDGKLSTSYTKINGNCKVSGDVEADKFNSEGAFEIEGLLSADEISIRLGGNSSAKEIGGEKIKVRGKPGPDDVQFSGFAGGRDPKSKRWSFQEFGVGIDIDIEKITDMIGQIGEEIGLHVSDYMGGGILETDSIEGDDIYLEYTHAAMVRGKRVVLGPHCEIGHVEYEESIEIDESSRVEQTTRF